jgi:hypothetical protein
VTISAEISRIVRHAVTPVAVVAVHQGWLPQAAQADVIELGVIVVSFAVALGMSWWEDRKRRKADEASGAEAA